jgi:hypothetical protein
VLPVTVLGLLLIAPIGQALGQATDGSGADDGAPEASPRKRKKTRKHAIPIEGDRDEVAPAPLPRKPRPVEDDEAPRKAGRGRSDDDELPDRSARAKPRRNLTIEEEFHADPETADDVTETRLALLDEDGRGLAAEGVIGALLVDHAPSGVSGRLAAGVRFIWQLGRVFRPEDEVLHKGVFLDLGYLYSRETEGTTEVNVGTSLHALDATLLAGYPFGNFVGYGRVGAGLFLQPVRYSVQGSALDFTGVKGGLVYGAGIRGSIPLGSVGLALGFEVTRFRRHYLNDTLIGMTVGAAF